MDAPSQESLAARFRAYHHEPSLLLLPNVWDAVSARLYQEEGFRAVATTSAGISAAQGFADGERMDVAETVRVVRTLVRVLRIPVSADIEAGYSSRTEGVVEAARRILEAGAVGLNLEDCRSENAGVESPQLLATEVQCERITAIREMANSAGIPLVVNARTDVYLAGRHGDPARLARAIERGNRYLEAGADCVFVPDVGDLEGPAIKELARELDGPLNVIAGRTTPSVERLEEMGVARLSFGPRPMRAALCLLQDIAREWVTTGTYERMCRGELTYDIINGWFSS